MTPKTTSLYEFSPKLTFGMFHFLDAGGTKQTLTFQFNPESLKRSRSASFKRTEASGKPDSQPGANQTTNNTQGKKYTLEVDQMKIDLDIRLDASIPLNQHEYSQAEPVAGAGLSSAIALLEQLITPGRPPSENQSTYGYTTLPDPPLVDFIWGDRVWRGFVTSLNLNETLFNVRLQPMRVEATVSFIVLEVGP